MRDLGFELVYQKDHEGRQRVGKEKAEELSLRVTERDRDAARMKATVEQLIEERYRRCLELQFVYGLGPISTPW